jgi:hypothetical protein
MLNLAHNTKEKNEYDYLSIITKTLHIKPSYLRATRIGIQIKCVI